MPLTARHDLERIIDDTAQKPWADRASVIELADAFVGGGKRGLNDVLGLSPVAGGEVGRPDGLYLVGARQRLGSDAVPSQWHPVGTSLRRTAEVLVGG